MKKKAAGFTMVELVVTVLIVSILTTIAYSSYQNTVRKGKRTEAQTELMDHAQRVQRCFTTNGTFVTSETELCEVLDNLAAEAGVETARRLYLLKASNITATTYKLTATPISRSGQDKDKDCASFTLNQAGVKKATNQSAADSTSDCW